MRIENSLQYVRDVTKGSDRSQLRSGNAPQIMAALCNLVITLMHRHWSDPIALTRRQFAYHPCQALKLLLHKRRSWEFHRTSEMRRILEWITCSLLGFWLRQDSSAFRLLDD